MRVGVDGRTGGVLMGWPHCQQSLEQIFTTALGTRCMRRDLDGLVPEVQDKPQNAAGFVRFVQAVAAAVRKYEPGFRLTGGGVKIVREGADGVVGWDVAGTFYPDGHLGDFTRGEPVTGRFASAILAPLTVGTLSP